MPSYLKHLIECNCILPQFLKHNPPVFHKFIVFSVLDDDGIFIPSFAQCNNCGAVHKVTEALTSKTISKDNISSLPKVQELKNGLSEKLIEIVEEYKPEIHTWQEIKFIVQNKLWGKTVILNKENIEGMITGKFLMIAGETLFKVDSFTLEEEDNED